MKHTTSDNAKTIQIDKDLTMKHAAQVLQELVSAEKKHEALHVVTKSESQMDLAGFQVLLAVANKTKENKKAFQLTLHLATESEQLLQRTGLGALLTQLNNS